MQELYKTKNQNLIEMAKTFERRRCNHPPQAPLPPHECIKSIVIVNGENKHRYVVATENEQLRWSLRKVPGIPLIYMNRSVMVMEPLSKASASISRNLEAKKLSGGLNDVKVGTANAGESAENEDANKLIKKRKGPKEPNPLSVKKKKKTDGNDQKDQKKEDGQKKRRRRKHKKHGEGEGEGEDEDGKDGEDKEDRENSNNNSDDKTLEPTSGTEQSHSEDDNEE